MIWITRLLDRTAKPWWLAVMAIAAWLWRMPMQEVLVRLRDVSGQSILDYEILYSRERVLEVFSAYGEEGARLYRLFMTYDLVFPSLYGLLFASLIHLGVAGTRYRFLVLAPMAMAAFDYLENALFVLMLGAHPGFPDAAVLAANATTLGKFGCGALSGLAGVVALVLFIRARWRPR